MPLELSPCPRRAVHRRAIDMQAFEREDGLFDVEARLVDTKPHTFLRPSSPVPVPANVPLHDLWVRMTLDRDYKVREISASSDTTPWAICKEAEGTLQTLVGERVARGWSAVVKSRLRGAQSCTHLMEMLLPMATTAIQAMRAAREGPPALAPQIDSCYAFDSNREVVQIHWPRMHGPDMRP